MRSSKSRFLIWSIASAVVVCLLSRPLSPASPFQTYLPNAQRRQSSILVLTAHPDDEVMFFAPTILSLVASNCQIYALCLSNGNSEGLGETRTRELWESYAMLGIHSEAIHLLDHPDLQDSMNSSWDPEQVAKVLSDYVLRLGIDTIITFDARGISGHPNHIALAKGSAFFIQRHHPSPQVTAFALKTVSLLSKYTGNLAAVYQHLIYLANTLMQHLTLANPSFRNPPSRFVFVSSFREYIKALSAMRKHSSQMVWFRYLYLLTSRYMWLNEWDVLVPRIVDEDNHNQSIPGPLQS